MTVALLDLKPSDCRFPIDGLFCAAERREGSSYCDHHHGLAYVTAGRRAFSSGGFMAEYTETVAPPRPARAHETVKPDRTPPSTALLDQFVRAAAARRHDAPEYPAPVAPPPKPVAVQSFIIPALPLDTHEGRLWFYLADLASQCKRAAPRVRTRSIRGLGYALYLRDFIACALDMTTEELLCNRRTKDLVLSRQFAMFCVARGALKMSLPTIGADVFDGFDHTTVLHARDKIGRMVSNGVLPPPLTTILDRICESDATIAQAVSKLRAPQPQPLAREVA